MSDDRENQAVPISQTALIDQASTKLLPINQAVPINWTTKKKDPGRDKPLILLEFSGYAFFTAPVF